MPSSCSGTHLSDPIAPMKNCFLSLRPAQSSDVMPDALTSATVASLPAPLQERTGLSQRRHDARRNIGGMANRHARSSAAGRLLRGAATLGAMFAVPSLARAQASSQQTESPCEELGGLRIALRSEYDSPGVAFDARVHGSAFDQHCAAIREVDQKHQTANYLFIPSEFFRSSAVRFEGFYDPIAGHAALDTSPIETAGEIGKFKDTVRHEARHRDIGQRNVRRNLADYGASTYGAFDPCLTRKDVKQCQQDLLNVPDLIKMLDVGLPEGADPALRGKIMLKIQEAMRALPSDDLVLVVNRAQFPKASRLFHGQLTRGPYQEDGFTRVNLHLPDDPDERLGDFISHLFHNTRLAIDSYTKNVESFQEAERIHMLAAEYDATLVGFYGLKSAQAMIAAASYLPAPHRDAEL